MAIAIYSRSFASPKIINITPCLFFYQPYLPSMCMYCIYSSVVCHWESSSGADHFKQKAEHFFFYIRIFCLRGGSTQFVHSQDAIAIR